MRGRSCARSFAAPDGASRSILPAVFSVLAAARTCLPLAESLLWLFYATERTKNMLKRSLCVLLSALVFLLSGCVAEAQKPDISGIGEGLTVYCFKAGKADAHLIYGEDWAVLIDCGEKGFGKDILKYMKKNGIERLDSLVITHFDKDHVGGAAKVLNGTEVGQVLQSGCPKKSSEYDNYLDALEDKGIDPVTVTERMSFTLGEAVFTIDPPRKDSYERSPENNSSLITEVTFGKRSLLFTGDAEDERLAEYTAANDKVFDLVKVPYHGHWQRELTPFAEEVKASIAVITSSDKEQEDKETVVLFERTGAEVFQTRTEAVIVRCDGEDIAAAYAG